MTESVQERQTSRAERRRRQIIEAAAKCFVRTGFAKTTMADIASQASLSKPVLYTYFDNKEAIIDALEKELVGQWLQTTRLPQQVKAGGYSAAIVASFKASFDFFFSQPVLREFFVAQASPFLVGRDSVIAAAISRVRDRLADFIARGQAAGEIRADIDPHATAELLRLLHVAMLDHNALSRVDDSVPNRDLADLSLDMMARTIR
jgi:AcrR family transcriptional regulator